MKIGMIGSGGVSQTLSAKLLQLGHDVMISARNKEDIHSPRQFGLTLQDWLLQNPSAKLGTFRDAAEHGEVLFNVSQGVHSISALQMAGGKEIGNKTLIDVANELYFPPTGGIHSLASQTRCLAENIQNAFPNLNVVKTLSTVSAPIMVNPQELANGNHSLFLTGNSLQSKEIVKNILLQFGWKDIIDLGGIEKSRGPEMLLGLWLQMFGVFESPLMNIKVVR